VEYLTTSQVAALISREHAPPGKSIADWQVRRVFNLGLLPQPTKAGLYRLIPASQVSEIVEIMRSRGWLAAKSEVEAAP
jgi:hypothetical protein